MLIQVPDVLYPGHTWLLSKDNREDLEEWVNQYDLTLKDMTVLSFTQVGIEATLQTRGEDGKLIIESNQVKTNFISLPYIKGTKPKVMKEGRALKYARKEGRSK